MSILGVLLFLIGTFTNAGAILIGAVLGLLLQRGIPEKVKHTVMQGMALAIMLIGFQMALETKNPLIVIISLVLGGLTGEMIDIEKRLNGIGEYLERRMGNRGKGVAPAFVTSSLVFCVGAMAVVGSIQEGLTGQYSTLLAKSLLDGITAIFFASTMGIGVIFSAAPILIYEGSLTLLAGLIKNLLSTGVISEVSSVGGLLIVGIALNILGLRPIKVGNLLPAILYAGIIAWGLQHLSLPLLFH